MRQVRCCPHKATSFPCCISSGKGIWSETPFLGPKASLLSHRRKISTGCRKSCRDDLTFWTCFFDAVMIRYAGLCIPLCIHCQEAWPGKSACATRAVNDLLKAASGLHSREVYPLSKISLDFGLERKGLWPS